ncbi:MAG TPA: glycosyl hydrolase family 28 protein [Puia sp.]|jgi:polygalacturonase|nr:glycosyl hydrolase family 28 protein [Puia sp.]
MKKIIPILLCYLLLSFQGKSQVIKDSMSGADYNIMRYGAIPDGKTMNTVAIQQAVNDCHKHGGGKIIIPAGNFITGTIRLYSNINFYFESGSILSGSEDDKDYLYQKDFGFSGPGAGSKTGILVAHDEENISITGFGTINGNGTHSMYMDSLQVGQDLSTQYTRQKSDYMNPSYGRKDGPVQWRGNYEDRPGVMIIFSNCKNIGISNIKLKESPNWTIAFLNSTDVKVSGITIENNMNIPNSDGIDMYDSKNITISDCIIQAGDDAIAVVSSSNITASNCILQSRSCGIRVGYNVFNDNNSGNLLFNNITIYDSNRGIGIFQRRLGNMGNMIFSNIIIDTRLHSGQWWGHGEPIHISSIPGLGSKESGTISNLRFSNITASSESGIVLFASDKGLLRDIYFDNVNLTIRNSALEKGYGGNIDLRPTNNIALGIFSHNIPALYATNVGGLSIRNMNVNWGDGLPDYFDHAVECSGFENITIDGLHEKLSKDGKAGSGSTVYLTNGGTHDIRNISSTDIKKKLISF